MLHGKQRSRNCIQLSLGRDEIRTLARDNFTWKRDTMHAIRSLAIEKKMNCKSLESSTVTGSTIYLRNIQMYLRNVFCFTGHENT